MGKMNITAIKTASNGVWQGDDPLDFAFPLLIVQATLVLLLSRSLAFLLRPLHQPKVIAEIIGGIILGPSALGRNKAYMERIFPPWSTPILETVASIGLLFFLFLVGLELDLASIRRSGRRAGAIAAAGITLPFVCGIGVAFVLRSSVPGADQVGFIQFLVFMGVALSITAFPVLARILAELKLLTTPVGEIAMAAAAFNDIAAWVLLALAVALSGGSHHKSPLISIWVLLSSFAYVAFVMTIIRPIMSRISRRSPGGGEAAVCLTLGGVLVSGFVTDAIGIHSIFGAFVFGLAIPKEGEFAGRLIERIEDFVSGLLLPLYFASSGLKTNVAKINGAQAWGLLGLVVFTACAGKILGTFAVAVACRMPKREALTLGVLMNTKGLVELIVLNIGKERKVLNDEIFAILVLMALFTTFITTPTVMAIYSPARRAARGGPSRRKLQHQNSADSTQLATDTGELHVLMCVHGPHDVPSMINLIETVRGTGRAALKLYILRLIELTERSSSIVMAQRARKNGLPFRNPLKKAAHNDDVSVAFEAYGQLGRVKVRPMTAVSALHTMHDDVCAVAEAKRAALVVLPFHRHGTDHVGPGWRAVNQRVIREAPCSVAVFVDRGFGGAQQVGPAEVAHGVCVVFFGGPDDREALELGGRMAEHPGVRVTLVRFVEVKSMAVTLRPSPEKCVEQSYSFSTAVMDRDKEKALDDVAVEAFQNQWGEKAGYNERAASNVVEAVLAIGRSKDYELVVVGKGRFPSSMVAELADRTAEHAELGPVGDILASSAHGAVSSILVVQQHDVVHAHETPVSKVIGEGSQSPSKVNGGGTGDIV
ncbi:Cation/H(+) antiporter 20 [Acorus calamus]|uniref:Cation/H(+) antiporter 20 n=1 Tax=Acorus calamus TaxID=4465 RepID=A0AAV9EDB8_ACOCL|nr:Cation/H(+) antiporter 20 [Acorus calamus]